MSKLLDSGPPITCYDCEKFDEGNCPEYNDVLAGGLFICPKFKIIKKKERS